MRHRQHPAGERAQQRSGDQDGAAATRVDRAAADAEGRRKSKCDYHFDRNLTKEELSEIERTVNSVILRDLPVTEEHVSRDVAAERFSLEKLPEDAGEVIRIVNIGDYDSCPCRGQHVTSTKEIGRFQLLSTGFTDGVLRVRFRIAGDNDHAVVL